MYISHTFLWHTLAEHNMRKEDLRLAAGSTTNMIANMGKGKHISMKPLTKICETLDYDISDVIQLEHEEACTDSTGND
ncbi:MAG: helix-turn-helix domain-containing protein [Roseburia sp.]